MTLSELYALMPIGCSVTASSREGLGKVIHRITIRTPRGVVFCEGAIKEACEMVYVLYERSVKNNWSAYDMSQRSLRVKQ